MGRANALPGAAAPAPSPRASASVRGVPVKARAPRTHTGNPCARRCCGGATIAYPPLGPGDALHLLVFGGSQGARVMGEVVPPAIAQPAGGPARPPRTSCSRRAPRT